MKEALWRVPIEGGDPIQLTDGMNSFPSVSPDGKLIASVYSEVALEQGANVAIYSIDGGKPLKVFPQQFSVAR